MVRLMEEERIAEEKIKLQIQTRKKLVEARKKQEKDEEMQK